MTHFLDVSPLYATHWSGIPQVTAAIARFLLAQHAHAAQFFSGNRLLEPALVAATLQQGHGRELPYLHLQQPSVPADALAAGTGIFVSPVAQTRRCAREVRVVCDLTALTHPQWHTADTVADAREYLACLRQSDRLVAISQATARDLHALGITENVQVAYPVPPLLPEVPAVLGPGEQVEPFLLMLGTIEPRKNIELVLQACAAQPELLAARRLVIAGRDGWGPPLRELIAQHLPPALQARVVQAGFVSETEKAALLAAADCLLLPSWHEGFGLPVLEALRTGCPVLCADRGALPEAGGECAFYFSPDGISSLLDAFARYAGADRQAVITAGKAHAAQFSADALPRACLT